jgi:magnesium chelatase family protein
LPGHAVKESRDRVTSAIGNSGLRWPGGKRITINLAPADVRKEGPSFDLPIALGMQNWKKTIGCLTLTRFT